MLNLAEKIMEWPLQICIEVEGVKYLLAHACTSMPDRVMIDEYYLMGSYFSGAEAYEMFCQMVGKDTFQFVDMIILWEVVKSGRTS